MDLQKCHKIDENLTSSDVALLKFLCIDLIPKRRLETVIDGKDLFLRLEEQALLDDGLLLPELLITIGHLDLLDILETTKEEVERLLTEREDSSKGVSPYRKMLLEISEDLTEENLRTVKFLLQLPRAKLGASASFLDVLIEMEKQQMLGEDNLDELHDVLDRCDKGLASRIKQFKNNNGYQESGDRLLQQEAFNSEPFFASDDCYKLTQRPLGHCLIINNYDFMEGTELGKRAGTDKDRDELSRVFGRMYFKVEVHEDLQAHEITDVVQQFANKNHNEMGAFVCCVLSHGEKGTVMGIDGKPIEIRNLTKPFAKCTSLTGKPKLFFIQACQGKEAQNGVWMEDGTTDDAKVYEEDARIAMGRSIPVEADFLIGMATVEYYLSYRHMTDGSIYIQELCRKLEELCPRKEDMLSILTKVNLEVSKKTLRGNKQMPEPRYTLTKKLVLPMD